MEVEPHALVAWSICVVIQHHYNVVLGNKLQHDCNVVTGVWLLCITNEVDVDCSVVPADVECGRAECWQSKLTIGKLHALVSLAECSIFLNNE